MTDSIMKLEKLEVFINMDKNKKEFYTKSELIKYIADKNDACNETVKSFINRKSSFSNYKDDNGGYRIPANIVQALNIIFKYSNKPEWNELRKPIINDKTFDDVLETYKMLIERIDPVEIEDKDRNLIEFILDTYTRKSQKELLDNTNAIINLITYESNELAYPSTLNICRYIQGINLEILLCVLAYKDKYNDEVFKELHKDYVQPKEQKELKEQMVEILKQVVNENPEKYKNKFNNFENIVRGNQ